METNASSDLNVNSRDPEPCRGLLFLGALALPSLGALGPWLLSPLRVASALRIGEELEAVEIALNPVSLSRSGSQACFCVDDFLELHRSS